MDTLKFKDMKEQLISFETSKLAKEKGFNERCTNLWYFKESYSDKPELHIQSTSHTRYVNCSKKYIGNSVSDYEESTITIEDLMKRPSNYPAEMHLYPAPTQSLLQKWLREGHGIHLIITPILCHLIPSNVVGYNYELLGKVFDEPDDTYSTYEEGLEAGLQHALKFI